MADTTDIEKKSLEAHVELCAERYKNLDDRLDALNEKITSVVTMTAGIKASVESMATKRNDQLISWGIGIITFLLGVVGYLINTHVLK